MNILDRKLLKEKQRELKEEVKGKPYLKALQPKFRFLIQVLKLVFEDIKSNRPFRSKRKANLQIEVN